MFGSHSITLSVPETRTYLDSISNQNYPPHNILKTKDGIRLELAVAGFYRDQIKVYTEEGCIYIEGNREETDEEAISYVHRGLAFRKFSRIWRMPEDLQVDKVDHRDGLVIIDFRKVIPEHQKRKDYL
jgi:HSP20 family molecular chaperone IbpA